MLVIFVRTIIFISLLNYYTLIKTFLIVRNFIFMLRLNKLGKTYMWSRDTPTIGW